MVCCESFTAEAKHRIKVQSNTLTADGTGGFTSDWTTVSTLWAVVRPKSGREIFTQGQDQSKVTHEVIIRYQSSFANTKDFAAYRILIENRIHAIKHVKNLASDFKNLGKEYQQILTEENEAVAA